MGTDPATNGEDTAGVDVCIVVPPYDQIKLPLLGPAILAAACRERALAVRTLYGNIRFAARVGYQPYKAVLRYYLDCIVGERTFREVAWPPEIAATLPPLPPLRERADRLFQWIAPQVPAFIDAFVADILAQRPKIVAITSTFEQIMAGSAIAWRIKAAAPDICIVMGGANIAQPMGGAFAGIFPWVDHFFAGEADLAFPAFCADYAATGLRPTERVIECPPLARIADSPMPDFADYFEQLRDEQAAGRLPADTLPEGLPLESSRGCWWGMKNHCTFCGLNGEGMEFRVKDPERVLAEIETLSSRWGVDYLNFTDNIMPLSYFKTLLPALAARGDTPGLFYEVKANLKYEQLRLMRQAGIVQIQPGIESLSTPVLKLMRKGVSAMQNLTLLRDATALGLHVLWNILYGFPGETPEDYAAFPDLFARIEHFRPPAYCVPIVVDRFSPHHKDPQAFGIESYAPYPGFAALFPPGTPVMDLGYHFIARGETAFMADADLHARVHAAFDAWQDAWGGGSPILAIVAVGSGEMVVDTRRIAKAKTAVLTAAEGAALRALDQPRRRADLPPEVADALAPMLDRGWVIEHEGQLLSIVVRPEEEARRTPNRREDYILV